MSSTEECQASDTPESSASECVLVESNMDESIEKSKECSVNLTRPHLKGSEEECKNTTNGTSDGEVKNQPLSTPVVTKAPQKPLLKVKNLSTANVGSATGNPRNKVALRPGHSLMDWIRLGNSGRDLTGVGGVLRDVPPSELVRHNRREDAWLAIKGRVYNVTVYMDFHPGGVEELMRGVGRDATALFNQVHAWVNYESILQKCQVGPLKGGLLMAAAPKASTNATPKSRAPLGQLLFGRKDQSKDTQEVEKSGNIPSPLAPPKPVNPRLDWFQQLGSVTLVLYARCIPRGAGRASPWARVKLDEEGLETSLLVCGMGGEPGLSYEVRLRLHAQVLWPCTALRAHPDSGKVEVVFRKATEQLWPRYGDPAKGHGTLLTGNVDSHFWPAHVVEQNEVARDCKLLVFKFTSRVCFTLPVGYHVQVQADVQGVSTSRSYTPVAAALLPALAPAEAQGCDVLCLMVKSYARGALSPVLCGLTNLQAGVELSEPMGSFDARVLGDVVQLYILAAGTGFTPMVRIILQVLQDSRKVCSKVSLMFFNKTEEDILWKDQLEKLASSDSRFIVQHVLSEAEDSWTGKKGRVSRSLLESLLDLTEGASASESFKQTPGMVCICGPEAFTHTTEDLIKEMGLAKEQYHCFLG